MSISVVDGDFNCLRGDCTNWKYTANINISLEDASETKLIIDVVLDAPPLTSWSWGEQ